MAATHNIWRGNLFLGILISTILLFSTVHLAKAVFVTGTGPGYINCNLIKEIDHNSTLLFAAVGAVDKTKSLDGSFGISGERFNATGPLTSIDNFDNQSYLLTYSALSNCPTSLEKNQSKPFSVMITGECDKRIQVVVKSEVLNGKYNLTNNFCSN